tara:strand:+ start:7322 stop:7612 length:291 start_codon:yes stop_codon:yes gene_type:complete
MNLKDAIISFAKQVAADGKEVTIDANSYAGKHWRAADGAKPTLEKLGVSIEWDGVSKTYKLTSSSKTSSKPEEKETEDSSDNFSGDKWWKKTKTDE